MFAQQQQEYCQQPQSSAAFADLTAVVLNEIDPYGQTQMSKDIQKTLKAPSRKPPSRVPNRKAPVLGSATSSSEENQPPGNLSAPPGVARNPPPGVTRSAPQRNAPLPGEVTIPVNPASFEEMEEGRFSPQRQPQQHPMQVPQMHLQPQQQYPVMYQTQEQPVHYSPEQQQYGVPPVQEQQQHFVPAPLDPYPFQNQMQQQFTEQPAQFVNHQQPLFVEQAQPTFTTDVPPAIDPFFQQPEVVEEALKGSEATQDTDDSSSVSSSDDSDSEDDSHHAGESEDLASLSTIIPLSFPSEEGLTKFLLAPIESEKLCKCLVMYDTTEKKWTFTNTSTGVRLMSAYKRKDGLKRLSAKSFFAIELSPRAIDMTEEAKIRLQYSKNSKDHYIAKLKSNVGGSSFELYDSGLNPGKAAGAMHARRELAAIKFEKLHNERRKCKAAVPDIECNRRPLSTKDFLFERLSQGDNTVIPLVNHLPGRPHTVPHRLADFNGLALSKSIKNMILHNPKARENPGDVIFLLGKSSKNMFQVFFKGPISPVSAFGFALASISAHAKA